MPRRISFSMTTPQFRDRAKTVTRRMGWLNLKAGDRLIAVEKAMGLKKGEKHVILGEIEVVSARREPVNAITQEDVVREGFSDWTPAQFVEFYCRGHHCKPWDECTRIEFRYLDHEATP